MHHDDPTSDLGPTSSGNDHLHQVLAEYLLAVDAGETPDRAELSARYPDLAGEFADYFSGHDQLEEFAGPLRCAVLAAPTGPVAPGDQTTINYHPSADDPDRARHERFADYELFAEVARGGMGVVYKARQVSLNRIVAVKMILAGRLAGDDDVRRFRAEAEAAANLRHPNIVAIHEVGAFRGQHYFSMDFVEGRSLAQIVRESPLSAARAAAYVRIVAEAIHHAHTQGILHRDLKPSNVLVDVDDQPRITDFGLAKRFAAGSETTFSGAVVGTASYMPPEQAAGQGAEVGPASDVYSLGAMLYELVTGRPPFRAETPLETLRQVRDCLPASPRALNPKLPQDLETICLKCLAKEPRQRYATARELAEELRRFVAGEPIHARPVGPVTRLARWATRHPIPAGLLGTGLVLLLIVTAAAISVARQFEARLGSEVLESNKYAARNVANTLRWQFERWSEALEQVALDPGLLEMLESSASTDELQAFIVDRHEFYAGPEGGLVDAGHPALFTNWFILDAQGQALARSPSLAHFLGKDYSFRDYFQGALATPTGQVQISHVYLSENDKLYKFALSAPVRRRGNGQSTRGVVVATVASDSSFGLDYLHDERRSALLVGPLDPRRGEDGAADTGPPRNAILVHPAYKTPGAEAVEIENDALRSVQSERRPGGPLLTKDAAHAVATDPNFHDPIRGGRWLAAFAPVADSQFVVVVEQPYDEAIESQGGLARQLTAWAGAALSLAVILMGTAVWFALRAGGHSHRGIRRSAQ
jgi:serine/threonine-protein kinase